MTPEFWIIEKWQKIISTNIARTYPAKSRRTFYIEIKIWEKRGNRKEEPGDDRAREEECVQWNEQRKKVRRNDLNDY